MKAAFTLRSLFGALTAGVLVVAGCQSPLGEYATRGPSLELGSEMNPEKDGVVRRATGGGHYLLSGLFDVQFALSAVVRADGRISGQFHQSLDVDGVKIEFHGTVTCLSVDEANGRAWVGGVITQNNSEDPDFQTAIHQPGRDIWFRLLDSGQHSPDPDRITFMGFEGSAGFITSEEYCAGMPWPADNARTHPVTAGNLTVTP